MRKKSFFGRMDFDREILNKPESHFGKMDFDRTIFDGNKKATKSSSIFDDEPFLGTWWGDDSNPLNPF